MPPTSSWNSSNQKSGKENSFPRLTFLRTQHSFFFSNLLRNNMITSVLLVSRCRSRHKDTNLRAIHNGLPQSLQRHKVVVLDTKILI